MEAGETNEEDYEEKENKWRQKTKRGNPTIERKMRQTKKQEIIKRR